MNIKLSKLIHAVLSVKKLIVLAVLLVFVMAGVAYAVANIYASQESEAGAKTGNVAVVSDTTASGGSAVKFGSAAGACPSSDTSHVPDGPDGMGGCWPGPLTTGPTYTPTNTLLPVPTGDNRYVLSGATTLDGYVFDHDILVTGQNVVIKNSIINGTIEVYESGSLTIEDSELHGGSADWSTIGGYNYDVARSEVDGGQQASICAGGCDWADVYTHSPHYFPEVDAHQSAFASTGIENGQPISLTHSTLWCDVPPAPTGGGCTANLALQANFGPIEYVTIDRNLFMPTETGAYCGTFGYSSGAPNPNAQLENHVIVTNNVFKRGPNGKCGFYGPVAAYNVFEPTNVWTNNKFDDGAAVDPTE